MWAVLPTSLLARLKTFTGSIAGGSGLDFRGLRV